MMDRRAFFALLAAAGLAPGALRAQSAWKLATGYRAESFHGQNLSQFLQALQASGLPTELHANNSLVKLADIAGAVKDGKIEMGEVIMTGLVKDIALAGADSVPFVVRSYDDARRMWRYQRPLIEKQFAERGLTVLFAVPWPPQGLYSNKPITRAADLRGAKMRTYNATTERIAQLLGAKPVDVPMVQVGQALADGRIDCMITSAVTGVENQVWDHVKNFYEINAWFPKNLTFVNSAALARLPAAQQQAVSKAAQAAEARGWAASEKAAADSVEELRHRGMKVERSSSELLVDIKRLGERFSLEWIREVGPDANMIFIPYYAQQ